MKKEAVSLKKGPVIDASLIDLHGLPEKEFPSDARFRVCIARSAHETVWKHARESVTAAHGGAVILEVGGVLVGNVYKDKDGPFLEIIAAIVGEHTRNQGTQMTFTPETWMEVNRVKDQRYADAKIVGWYHTHPRFGIFLSDMDKFIHKNHFPQPWTTALVVDPVQETEGFFVWSEGETSQAPEFWVGSERRSKPPAAVPLPSAPSPETTSAKDPGGAVSRASFALAAVLGFLALVFLSGYVYMREVSHSETEKLVMGFLTQQKDHLQQLSGEVANLDKQLDATHKESTEAEKRLKLDVQRVARELAAEAGEVEGLHQAIATQQLTLDRVVAGSPEKQNAPLPEVKKK